jgi:DNA-binding NarL/FixJ family response regulator
MQASDTAQTDQTERTDHSDAHEHILQLLSAIMLQINALQSMTHGHALPDVGAIRTGLAAMEQIAREAIHELRAASDDPPLPELVGVTLVDALTRAVEETAEALGLSSRVSFSGEERTLPSYTERLLYRIAQEALYQVQRHSNARRLRFTFNFGRDEVTMSIEDDGTSQNETSVPLQEEEIDAQLTGEEDTPLPHFRAASQSVNMYERDAFNTFDSLRHRIEHLGGTLDVGTQFIVSTSTADTPTTRVQAHVPYTMPTAHVQSSPPPVGAQFIAPTTTDKIHILVVDNQAVSRAGLRRLLESYADLQVIGEAADGVQAVSETLELGPQVVLMDALLPNGQSMEALKQIKQLNLNARVLLLSAQDREEFLYETLQAGADGYVLKDIAPDELAQAIRSVARGEVLVQPQLANRFFSRFGKQGQGRGQGRGSFPYETLTAREQDVLQLLARGLRNKEIAARLHVSERTVNFHLANIYQKLNVSGRTEALSRALEQGLITV